MHKRRGWINVAENSIRINRPSRVDSAVNVGLMTEIVKRRSAMPRSRRRGTASFTNEDARQSAELLAEFTDKIREMGLKISDEKLNLWRFMAQSLIVGGAVGYYSLYRTSPLSLPPTSHVSPMVLLFFALALIMGTCVYAMIRSKNQMEQIQFMQEDAFTLAAQMRHVTSKVSELLEYGRLSSIEELELKLRLTDAEGALRMLSHITKRKFESVKIPDGLKRQAVDLGVHKVGNVTYFGKNSQLSGIAKVVDGKVVLEGTH